MSVHSRSRLLLRLYPRAWRERYGEELDVLLLAIESDGGAGWRARADVVRGALAERLRGWGFGRGVPPYERARGGLLLVLVAWVAFVIAGVRVQKLSEHWQDATPIAHRALPAAAFDALVAFAALGGALVLVGLAFALPRSVSYLRSDGFGAVRRPLLRAALASLPALAAFVVVLVWSRRLGVAERNGADAAYTAAFVCFGALAALAVACWTAAGVAIARRLRLSVTLLRLEALLAGAVSAAMLATTVATGLWWGALARAAPWRLHGGSIGASPLTANVVMLLASCVAVLGATRSLLAARRLRAAGPASN